MIPSTWIDATDDVCPRPRHERRLPTPQEMREAESIEPRHEDAARVRKPGSGRGRLDLRKFWEGTWACERDWLIDMLRIHRTAKAIGLIAGYSKGAMSKRIKHHGIPVVKGWHGGLVE